MSALSRRNVLRGGLVATTAGVVAPGLGAGAAAAAPDGTARPPSPRPAMVGPGDRRFRSLATRGYNRRFVGSPEHVWVVGRTADVVRAVRQAVDSGRRITVRSGGHGFENFAADPAVEVVVDMSAMTGVSYDPGRRAFAVEAGALLGEVYRRLYLGWGVTIPAGWCAGVGVGGHILGGGYGPLSRLMGLSVDHLYAVEVVVVDRRGRARTVVATREPSDPHRDLWWAHTGGGAGTFGIVTRYWFRTPGAVGDDPAGLLPAPPAGVLSFQVSWDWEKLDRTSFARLVRNHGEWAEKHSAPDSPYLALYSELALTRRPSGTVLMIGQVAADSGAERMLDEYIAALSRGVPVQPVRTVRNQAWLAAALAGSPGDPGPVYRLKVTILAALAAVTEHLGLTGTINSTFNEPYEVARQFAGLDHLSGGRSAWNVVTSWDAFTGENFRRGGFLPQEERYSRAKEFLATANELFDSWHGDEILADQETGTFLRDAKAGAFVHTGQHFDIHGQFNVPRSPQGRPVIFQAGDSEEGREFAAAEADAIFSRYGTLEGGRSFYTDVKSRLAKYGRRPDQLLILPAATFALADTDAQAEELAREVRRRQVSGATALKHLEFVWNRDLSAYDPEGPLPDIDPDVSDNHISKGRAQVRMYRDPLATAREWRELAEANKWSIRDLVINTGNRQNFVGSPGHHRPDHQRLRAGRRRRRLHPRPAHHPDRPRRVRRQGGAAAPGTGRVPHRVRGHDSARPPRAGPPRRRADPRRAGGVVKFLAITLIVHRPDPVTGVLKPTHDRFREVLDNALLAEELGFDGFGVGERHERPFISSSPTVVLSHVAALTRRIRLFTAVTTLSLLDPVRAYEDYATLDHLSEGRLDLIIGKGNGAAQRELFQVTPKDQWDRNAESYEVFRRIWRQDKVTAATRFRPPLTDAEVWPRPYQQPVRVWHGSATSKESVDLAARYGDPLFSANVTHPIEPYAELIRHYRERWEHYGHDPADIAIGAGSAGIHVAPTSQQALAAYRPVFEANLAFYRQAGLPVVFETLEDFVERSSALIGSPQQVIDKVHRYHDQFGHTALHLHADASGLTDTQHRDSLELFQSAVAPVLRKDIPDPPFAWAPVYTTSPTAQERVHV